MTESEARDEICRVGRSLFERGYVQASADNISVRLDDPKSGSYPAAVSRSDGSHGGSGRVILATT